MNTLRRRHTLMASLRGQIPDDGRKTFRRNPRVAGGFVWRLVFSVPTLAPFAPGPTGYGVNALLDGTFEVRGTNRHQVTARAEAFLARHGLVAELSNPKRIKAEA